MNKTSGNNKIYFFTGLGLVIVSALVFVILGGGSIFINHDQMDGEMLCYILSARHMFDGRSVFPEFMNGMPKTSLIPPALLFVPLFRFLSPFAAFVLMRYISMAFAYIGMYLLLQKRGSSSPVSALIALVFAYAPFIHVYGFSMYGVPMLAYAFLCLEDRAVGAMEGKSSLKYFALIILTALGSSLVLSGFAMLATAGIHFIFLLCKKEKNRARWTFFGGVALFITYILCNLSLVKQILGIGDAGYASHKDEVSLVAKPFLDNFAEAFLSGAEHSGFERTLILLMAVIAVIYVGVIRKEGRNVRLIAIRRTFFALLFMAIIAALYECSAVTDFRMSTTGPLRWFQVSRIDWLAPAMLLVMLTDVIEILIEKNKILAVASVFVAALTFGLFIHADTWKDNAKVLLGRDSALLSWDEYYASDVFDKAASVIEDATGEKKSDYKCVSLGITPAAALYNGFSCLDGYSNNYDVEYKHEFRKIIAPELEKNDYIKTYFDEWGNRCYLYAAQIPGYFTVEKSGFYFADYDIDTEALKALGGKYLFSAAYIDGAEDEGLTLLTEEPIETDTSYYKLYIYEVN
ncbi:MAG: hypothetical protein J5537_03840 [Lachnospiraceae bacterium]|nr:hypothetical protein [Lachnospiraceae bacterium]